MVLDEKGNLYELHDSLPLLHVRSVNIFMELRRNKQYEIEGYGFKIPGTDVYPNIIKITPI
tara:strand:+ start:321 stop:503 length:183 start_codon:yes stop_codon:yes gene_type:complete